MTAQKKIDHLQQLEDAYKDLHTNAGPNHPVIKFNREFIAELKES